MRTLDYKELEVVSGGDWSFEIDLGITKWVVSGDETIQDIGRGIASAGSDAYWTARDAFADLWSAWDPQNYYTTCPGAGGGGGGGR